MELFTNKSKCYGCGACENACSVNALRMFPDEEGFLYPKIDTRKCIECGACKRVCQIHSINNKNTIAPLVFAAKNKDEDVRSQSTSGGMFSVFAEYILEKNGVIYGVAFDEKFNVLHGRAETRDEYRKFLGSKYVQSKTGDSYKRVKNDLKDGRYVLFTGTPCQIAGLATYLGEEVDNERLILCEIICHGAPSPLMWREHINLLEKTHKSNLVKYKNRSKVAGWHGHNEHGFFENGKNDYKSKLSQNHKDLFYAHLIIRPSCYECNYTGFPRMSDFSIADYWGIELCMKEFDDNKGTSLLIVNTEKGKKIFDEVKGNIEYRESNLEDAFRDNHKHPAKRNVNRGEFWRDYQEHGYLYVIKKYSEYTTIGKIKRQIKFKVKALTKTIGIYKLIHKFTQKKYQKATYK